MNQISCFVNCRWFLFSDRSSSETEILLGPILLTPHLFSAVGRELVLISKELLASNMLNLEQLPGSEDSLETVVASSLSSSLYPLGLDLMS